jgi:hypothetical protein
MGRSPGKKQLLVYLSIEAHRNLAIESARLGLSMSEMVETALRRWTFSEHHIKPKKKSV